LTNKAPTRARWSVVAGRCLPRVPPGDPEAICGGGSVAPWLRPRSESKPAYPRTIHIHDQGMHREITMGSGGEHPCECIYDMNASRTEINTAPIVNPRQLVKGDLRPLPLDDPNLLPLGHCESRSGPRSSGRLPLLPSLISLALLLALERRLSVLAKRRGGPSRLGGDSDIPTLGDVFGGIFGGVVLGPGTLGTARFGRQRLLLAAGTLGRFGRGVLRVVVSAEQSVGVQY
jgi:hypothetical protein